MFHARIFLHFISFDSRFETTKAMNLQAKWDELNEELDSGCWIDCRMEGKRQWARDRGQKDDLDWGLGD